MGEAFFTEMVKCLTLTFQSLPGEPPQQRTTVLTESGTFVVVDFKPVRHVDFEALLVDLQQTHTVIMDKWEYFYIIIPQSLTLYLQPLCRHRITVEHRRYDGSNGDNIPHIDNVSSGT